MPLCLIESPLLQRPRPLAARSDWREVALNVTPYRKIMPMAVARVCTRSIPGERRETWPCVALEKRVFIYIYIYTLWMPIRRNKEEGGRRGHVGQDRAFKWNGGSRDIRDIALFTNYPEKGEYMNVYFFVVCGFSLERLVTPQNEVIIETIHSFGWLGLLVDRDFVLMRSPIVWEKY